MKTISRGLVLNFGDTSSLRSDIPRRIYNYPTLGRNLKMVFSSLYIQSLCAKDGYTACCIEHVSGDAWAAILAPHQSLEYTSLTVTRPHLIMGQDHTINAVLHKINIGIRFPDSGKKQVNSEHGLQWFQWRVNNTLRRWVFPGNPLIYKLCFWEYLIIALAVPG